MWRIAYPFAEQDGSVSGIAPGVRTSVGPVAPSGSGSVSGLAAPRPSAASVRMEALRQRIRAKELAGKSSAAKRRLWRKTTDPVWHEAALAGSVSSPAP